MTFSRELLRPAACDAGALLLRSRGHGEGPSMDARVKHEAPKRCTSAGAGATRHSPPASSCRFPYVFAIAGAVLGGWSADRLMRAGLCPVNSRKMPIVCALAGMVLCTFGAALTLGVQGVVACVSRALFVSGGLGLLGFALAVPANCNAYGGAMRPTGQAG